MTAIKDLKTLLASLEPELDERSFVFCSFEQQPSADQISRMHPIGMFREKEGLTAIITQEVAESCQIPFEGVYKLISLKVHSSLESVGLTATVTNKLAKKNIGANVVAAFYHDHIFVLEEKAEQALTVIQELQSDYQSIEYHFY